MNETYWLPLDVDAYLEVDYGNRWPETELAAQCLGSPIGTLRVKIFIYILYITRCPTFENEIDPGLTDLS